jgi:uncharacterized protein YndB with AHSA1/START domain
VSAGAPQGALARPLTVRRTFAFPREVVFEAWTDPDAIVVWFGGTFAKILSVAVDLRVGGAYRLTTQSGSQVFALEGVYREVEPPARLVYTWRWDGLDFEEGRESLVTVEFLERDDTTEVVVTHEGVDTTRSFTFHHGGWTASLEGLQQVLAR